MEGSAVAAAADPSASTFFQVIFDNIPHSYLPATSVTCHYSLTAAFQPHPRDWVGIFKVGWSTAKDYHTFVWVEPCQDVVGPESVRRQAVFKDYYLPKDEMEFYQFCYIDSTGQARGASTSFCFKTPDEQSIENVTDEDLLFITTQEQVEQSIREKAELQKELAQMKEENEMLKSSLQKEQQQAAILKEELLGQTTKQVEIQQHGSPKQKKMHSPEKYNRALVKINQLKEERKELKERIDVQSEEINKLNCKLREEDGELTKTKDSMQLLQVDLRFSETENERLAAELQRLQSVTHDMDEVKRENRELCWRLSQQDTPQDGDLTVHCQTLVRQLEETRAELAAEKEETRNARRQAEVRDREVGDVRKRLEDLLASSDEAKRQLDATELELRDGLEGLRLMKREKEELDTKKQSLISEAEDLRRVVANLRASFAAESPRVQPRATSPAEDTATSHEWQLQNTTEQADDQCEPPGGMAESEEGQSLVCRHCQERFPGITQGELDQHEQSHRVCPFCTMLCDNMGQSLFEDHVYSHEL